MVTTAIVLQDGRERIVEQILMIVTLIFVSMEVLAQ